MEEGGAIPPEDAAAPVWEDGGWAGLAPLNGDVRADVCVVGLGGSGLAAVGALLDAGVTVAGVDASSIAAGAAGRNGGLLLAGGYHFHHDAVAKYGRQRARGMYEHTLSQMERMLAETPAAIRRTGSLRIATSDEELEDCRGQLKAMQADALSVEWYRGREGEGLLIPTDCVFNPLQRARALASAALSRGARLYEGSPATSISGDVVITPSGRVSCGTVIIAVDGLLGRVLPELCGRVRTARLQMLATAPAPEVHYPRPVYARYGMEYWQQLPDARIALGGFRDAGGEGEWTDSTEPGEVVQQRLESYLRETVGVTAPVERRWAASVSYTADGLPILEEVRARVWAVGGYSGTGNVVGAICGRAAAELAVTGRSETGLLFSGSAPAA